MLFDDGGLLARVYLYQIRNGLAALNRCAD
jgi:hypothetical protein